jgi:hypothetical protein
MESDALCMSEEPKDIDKFPNKMTSKVCEKRALLATTTSPSVTVLVCGLCVLSFAASGYFSYRETVLESRLGVLEAQFAAMRSTVGGSGDVIVERLRREVEARFQQRMNREVATGRRLLMDAAAASSMQAPQQQVPLSLLALQKQHIRAPRDVSECICPPGRAILYRYFI